MNPNNILFLFPFVAAVGVILGVIVVSRYPDRPFAVPLARVTLLLGAGFMLWLGWICFNDLPDSPLLNWTCVVLGLGCGALFGGGALFGRGEAVLRNIQHIRDGF